MNQLTFLASISDTTDVCNFNIIGYHVTIRGIFPTASHVSQ